MSPALPVGRYVIITPVRNEMDHIEKTLSSVLSQTHTPAEWVLVDDGSTDRTAEIIASYAKKTPWLRLLRREDRGYREAGAGVIEAFYAGYDALTVKNWQYLVKLDGDLSFADAYFATCLRRFADRPSLGIAGGTICLLKDGSPVPETAYDPLFHVRGATKIYRRGCWQEIGGLLRAPGWDTLDELKANMLGWQTQSFQDLPLVHYRKSGEAEGRWRNWVKNGRANYITGYHPLFMFLKCVRRLPMKPQLVQSAGLFYGYFTSYIKNVRRVDDPPLIRYLREQQMNKLLNRRSIWNY